jgi:hypothetical protein
VISADRHPDDARLVAAYFDPDGVDDSLTLHLFRCSPCSRRRDELASLLDRVHDTALHEADEEMDARRLSAQRESILARTVDRTAARILAFPPQERRVLGSRPAARAARRWIAAAAVVVFAAGAAAGRFVTLHERRAISPSPSSNRAAAYQPALARAATADVSVHDERLLSEIELALASPGTPEALRALDDFTPHARDAVLRARR